MELVQETTASAAAAGGDVGGVDSEGNEYSSIEEMWAMHGVLPLPRSASATASASSSSSSSKRSVLVAPLAASSASAAASHANMTTADSGVDSDASSRLAREALRRWYQSGGCGCFQSPNSEGMFVCEQRSPFCHLQLRTGKGKRPQ